jgi:hypothetical protein
LTFPYTLRHALAMAKTKVRYGWHWWETQCDLAIEMECIRKGGKWLNPHGVECGAGLFHHYKEGIRLLWPNFIQHRWTDLMLKEWLQHKYVGILGPRNSSKTGFMAVLHLFDYYCFSTCTSVLVCTTTLKLSEGRIWGEIKKRHQEARAAYEWLPGHLIEGKQLIVTDDKSRIEEGRDFRNGLMVIPLVRGGPKVGVTSIIGIKNKRKRIYGDEAQALQMAFIDGLANFMEPGADCKATGAGNPSEPTDPLGMLCQPHDSLGGWDSNIDQTPKTKTWRTRWNGVAIQLPGGDSPNNDHPPGEPGPYPFLINKTTMDEDARIWGRNDWHFKMFDEGQMPRGQGANRIITRGLCIKNHALDEPLWANTRRTRIAFLDAAYRQVGGDRCVFGTLEFGDELARLITNDGSANASALIRQQETTFGNRQILALTDMQIVPIESTSIQIDPEDQIAAFVQKQCVLRNIPPENFYFDAGMRTSLVTALARLWSPQVNSIDFGGRPSEGMVSANIEIPNREYYDRFVTELWYRLRLVIEAGQFRGMTEDVMAEGCMREFKMVGNKIAVETKKEMKEKTRRSPDLVDALCAGLYGATKKGFAIKRVESAASVKQSDRWKSQMREKRDEFWKQGALAGA